MAITLNQLLKKSYHGELKCVAGHKGLDKEILGVNVVDNPEIVSCFMAVSLYCQRDM